eukprot:16442461-Heterocapsa_arctica.AAC.1
MFSAAVTMSLLDSRWKMTSMWSVGGRGRRLAVMPRWRRAAATACSPGDAASPSAVASAVVEASSA